MAGFEDAPDALEGLLFCLGVSPDLMDGVLPPVDGEEDGSFLTDLALDAELSPSVLTTEGLGEGVALPPPAAFFFGLFRWALILEKGSDRIGIPLDVFSFQSPVDRFSKRSTFNFCCEYCLEMVIESIHPSGQYGSI